MKLNLGSGPLPLDGYVNVDRYETADIMADVTDFVDGSFRDVSEVRMDHMLEHLSFDEGRQLLATCRQWMRPGGILVVEVPDMDRINAGTEQWERYMYGCQAHPGEFHRSGYTADTLGRAVRDAGFHLEEVDAFLSANMNRPGMPCVKAVGVAGGAK